MGAFGKINVVVGREVGAGDGDSGDLRILVVLKTLELSVPGKSSRWEKMKTEGKN